MIEKRKNRLIKIYIIAVIILLIFLHYLKVLSWPENLMLNILSSWQNKTYVFTSKIKYSFINYQEAQNLKVENADLKSQLNQLLYENSQLNAYKLENEKLRSFLNYFTTTQFNYHLAKVIGRDMARANTLIIDQGKADGLKEGMAVTVDQGIMIGKIIEVKDKLATILLLTDSHSQVAVSTLEVNKSIGLATGEYGLSLKVELVPQDIALREGDTIITSGLENDVPRGLIVGKINRIISNENDLFKSATITPLFDFEEVNLVSIIIPNNQSQ